MKAPIYRAGEAIYMAGRHIGEAFQNDGVVLCQIIHANEDGTYFVRVNKTGGYAIIDESDLAGHPEYDMERPYDRSRIRVVFFGNGHFALPTLKMLIEKGYDVAAVVTAEDKKGSHRNEFRPSPVKEYAESVGLLVYQPHKLNSNRFLRHISDLHPTIGVVVEYKILPSELFSIPKWGTINLHSSLLPMYRGASTITSAIQDGNEMTGVTTFSIDSGMDTGRVINNLGVRIYETDSAENVHIRLRLFGATMVDDAIQRIAHSCRPVPQHELFCDFIRPSYAPKLHRNDSYIDWLAPADKVYNFIRARSSIICGDSFPKQPAIAGSVPTAWTSVKMLESDSATDIKIHKTSKTGIHRGHHAPGEWFWEGSKLYVACWDELLSIDILQLQGKKRMTAKEYHNGFRGACKGFCNLTYQALDKATIIT